MVCGFPVDGEEKILSVTQRSLLRQLIEEEETEPLPGRTLMIKCLDLKSKKEWKIREVKATGTIQSFNSEKVEDTGEEKEPEAIKEAPAQDTKAREKFKGEVQKRTKKRKEAEKKEVAIDAQEVADPDREREDREET
jgi:hypothetical protein